jgi:hypothetical protein
MTPNPPVYAQQPQYGTAQQYVLQQGYAQMTQPGMGQALQQQYAQQQMMQQAAQAQYY